EILVAEGNLRSMVPGVGSTVTVDRLDRQFGRQSEWTENFLHHLENATCLHVLVERQIGRVGGLPVLHTHLVGSGICSDGGRSGTEAQEPQAWQQECLAGERHGMNSRSSHTMSGCRGADRRCRAVAAAADPASWRCPI